METIKTIMVMMMLMMTGVFAQSGGGTDSDFPPEPPSPPAPPSAWPSGITSTGITAVVHGPTTGPYVRQNPVYVSVDYVPSNSLIMEPTIIRDLDVNGQNNRVLNTMAIGVVDQPISIPFGYMFVKKRWGNTFFIDISETATLYPWLSGAEVVR